MIFIEPGFGILTNARPNHDPSQNLLDFTQLISEHSEKHFFSMEGYNVWCNGVVKGDDGKCHMYFSRLLKSRGHEAWATHFKIAHAVSDSLFGSYHFSDICLTARGNQFWDGAMTHNPDVIRYNGKYYLYYNANKGSRYWNINADAKMLKMTHLNWINRNNHRIGVAVADRFNWTLSPNSFEHKFSIAFKDAEHLEFNRSEIAKVYLENGKVATSFLAAKPKDKEDSFSMVSG
ncbi:MAG: hypothetical protein Q8910_09780 [Bacteroidota bacterium]|nr:hypothetical protein [Bacteroidota bacterium]